MSETMKNLVEGEDAFRDDGGVGKIGPLRFEALLEHREYTREVQDQEAFSFPNLIFLKNYWWES